jgi:NAD(P)-dependent dehydrogenase (short-subunit alcohol dehydrogenase family)
MSKRKGESVRDKRVLVTGAASGIGRAAASRFREAGARVVMLDVTEGPLREAARDANAVQAAPDVPPPLVLPCDLRNAGAVAAGATRALEHWNGIDVLVNNAGLLMGGPFHEGDPARMRDVVEVNLYAPIHLTRLLLPHMIERGTGHIVNVISSSALLGVPGFAVYEATKAGLIAFTRVLRRELAGGDIRLTTFCPGSTVSGMTRAMLEFGRGAAAQPHHPPETPAAALVDAVARNRPHVAVSSRPRTLAFFTFLDRLFPHLMDRYWERQVRAGEWLEGARRGGL